MCMYNKVMSQEKVEEKDSFLATKEAEARVLKLQSEVQHLKQRIQLSESEERAEIEEYNKKIKENDELIKELKNEVQDLQILKMKGMRGDERIIARAFRKHSREVGILAGKSGKEAIEILDEKVLRLIKKSNILSHETRLKEMELAELKQQGKQVAWRIHSEFETEATDSETTRRVRELENDYQKVEKNLVECQVIQAKYKIIQEQLQKELMAYPVLLGELEQQYRAQRADLQNLSSSEKKALERREAVRKELSEMEAEATRARHEKERIISEYSKALKPKQLSSEKQTEETRDTETADQWRQLKDVQEAEINNYKEAFEKIKEAIGISDINDAEERFVSQKATKEELTELVEQAEQKLREMKAEAEELQIKNENLRGGELAFPQIALEKELDEAKVKLEEQTARKATAEAELETIKKLYSDVKSGLWQQLQLMEKYMKEDDEYTTSTPDEEAIVIVTRIEELLQNVFDKLKDQDIEDLKAKLKEEQFMQKMEPVQFLQSAGAVRKFKTAAEEESSDEEDFEKKRAMLKKEAQAYAEIKKKQQGRGRMMML